MELITFPSVGVQKCRSNPIISAKIQESKLNYIFFSGNSEMQRKSHFLHWEFRNAEESIGVSVRTQEYRRNLIVKNERPELRILLIHY